MSTRLDDAIKQIKEIHLIMTGNGHPENGLVFKVAQNTAHRNFMNRIGWLIITGMVGVPFAALAIWVKAGMAGQ